MEANCSKNDLIQLRPAHVTFVGIDSDGCVFDTMEAKQKLCFHGLIVSHWKMESAEKAVREAAEFVNLYSKWRGTNRFAALLKTFELLARHPAVLRAGIRVPVLPELAGFVASGRALSNASLREAAERTASRELASVLAWSEAVNALIEERVPDVPPFPFARESLELISGNSDAMCISQTPSAALAREWARNGLTGFVRLIAGQELGTKSEHIRMATAGRYGPGRVLMIGDAMGDLAAARENGALFYPIVPGREEDSWRLFHSRCYGLFLDGRYAGAPERELVREFESVLPEEPRWS
jgi:phosphoglycolate phosphatase-like HAD superfamily hydrolase